jgi:hypothetical protein
MIPTKEMLEEDIQSLKLFEIAKKYGLSDSTTYRLICSFGLKLSKRRKYRLEKGRVFGKLTVIDQDHTQNKALWICQCECGNIKLARTEHLLKGCQKSCGCSEHEGRWKGCGEISGDYWSRVVRGAKSRNLPLEITIQEAWNKFLEQNRKCTLTGLELYFCRNPKKPDKEHTASLDRIDSSLGYTKNNIEWIHKFVQGMKSNYKKEDVIYYSKLIANNHKEK